MDKHEIQKLIDKVKKSGEPHDLGAGRFLARGDDVIEDLKYWPENDKCKEMQIDPSAVYFWADVLVEADADELAECI